MANILLVLRLSFFRYIMKKKIIQPNNLCISERPNNDYIDEIYQFTKKRLKDFIH